MTSDGTRVAAGFGDTSVKIWSLPDGRMLRTLNGHARLVSHGSFSPDGTALLTIDDGGTIRLRSVADGSERYAIQAHSGNLNIVAFSPDGVRFASSGGDRVVKVWLTQDGSLLRTFNGHTKPVSGLSFSSDGNTLVSAGWDRLVNLWDIPGDQSLGGFTITGTPYAAVLTPDGQSVAVGALKEVQFWSLGGSLQQSLPGYSQRVSAIAFSADGTVLSAGDTTGIVKHWDLSSGQPVDVAPAPLNPYGQFLNSVALSADGQTVAFLGEQRALQTWRAVAKTTQTISLHTYGLTSAAFSRDGLLVATAGGETVNLLKASDGALIHRWAVISGSFEDDTVAFSSDGNLVVGGTSDGYIRLWRTGDGGLAREIPAHVGQVPGVTALAVSPDGTLIASGGRDKRVRLWHLSDGSSVREFAGHVDTILGLEFAPDGLTLASASADKTARLWNVSDGALLQTLGAHVDAVLDVLFAPDAKTLATVAGKAVRLWRTVDGSLIRTLPSQLPMISAQFLSGGDALAVVTADFFSKPQADVGFWRTSDGSVLGTLERETHFALAFAPSPDGSQLALRRIDGSLVMLRNPLAVTATEPRLQVTGTAALLSLKLEGQTGTRYRVEQSADLKQWAELTTLTSTSATTTIPLGPAGSGARFFRSQTE